MNWDDEIEPAEYEEMFFSNIPTGPDFVVSRILIPTPKRRWYHRLLWATGVGRIQNWLYERRLERDE